MAERRNIAFLANDLMLLGALADDMRECGFRAVHHRLADEAIDDFVRGRKYSLIAMQVGIAPGDYTDHVIRTAMACGPLYHEVGLRVIELTRQKTSLNRDTSIAVLDTYLPAKDGLFPDASRRCIEKGADAYFYMGGVENFDRLYDRLVAMAGKSHSRG